MRIIIDAMGGDNAPQAIVKGAVAGINEFPDVTIVLTGDQYRMGRYQAGLPMIKTVLRSCIRRRLLK